MQNDKRSIIDYFKDKKKFFIVFIICILMYSVIGSVVEPGTVIPTFKTDFITFLLLTIFIDLPIFFSGIFTLIANKKKQPDERMEKGTTLCIIIICTMIFLLLVLRPLSIYYSVQTGYYDHPLMLRTK